MFPKDLGGYEGHRHRKGGDLGHVDRERSKLNRQLIGSEDWAAMALAEIDDMRTGNFASELEKLRKRRRTAEIRKRIVEGPRDPWRSTRHGPLREVILTANKAWFEEIDSESFDDLFGGTREERFEALAVSWLTEHFGDDLIHARADLDEEAYHIHAIILPRGETKDGRRMLQPSKHAMIRDYEAAQDSVGAWFSEIGLHRGERRAEAIRAAIKHNRQIEDRNADPESQGAAEDDATTV
ncbi:plasmid recombination protein, partial [Salipiger bermudensis]|uniref:plasmid recombination protein n=1 Tax=Salipiger bermudensis TaxID=344736 RepID=UPI003512A1A8